MIHTDLLEGTNKSIGVPELPCTSSQGENKIEYMDEKSISMLHESITDQFPHRNALMSM